MSTLKAENIQSITTGPPIFKTSNGTEIGQLAKAWVNFDGTGTVAIRDDFNISSIIDNGTGDYTVNFENDMANTNYAVAGSGKRSGTGSADIFFALKQSTTYNAHTTANIRVATRFDNAQGGDSDAVSVIIFGGDS